MSECGQLHEVHVEERLVSPMSCNCFGTRSDALRDDHYTPIGMHNPQPTAPGDELVVLSKDGNKPVNLALTQDGMVVVKSKKGECSFDISAACTRRPSTLTLPRPRLLPTLPNTGFALAQDRFIRSSCPVVRSEIVCLGDTN